MPKDIVNSIKFGPSRFAMIDTTARLVESMRDDFMPGVKTWDAFALMLIVRHMWLRHRRGTLASAAGIARSIGMPRSTAHRRLRFLEKLGAVERRGVGYAIVAEYINSPHGAVDVGVKGFRGRVTRWHEAGKKIVNLGD